MNNNESSPWDGTEVISAYSREQAIADGALADVSPMAREAGFKVPVAVTEAVWAMLQPSEQDRALGQSLEGRLWDVLSVLRARATERDAIPFTVVLAQADRPRRVQLKATCGPGDGAEPVITIMLPGED